MCKIIECKYRKALKIFSVCELLEKIRGTDIKISTECRPLSARGDCPLMNKHNEIGEI